MSSSEVLKPCAGCTHLQQQCAPDCAYALYFPARDRELFVLVHAIFGARNAAKLLAELESEMRAGAVQNLVDQAMKWLKETNFSGVAYIDFLQNMLEGHGVAARVQFEEIGEAAAVQSVAAQQSAGHGAMSARPCAGCKHLKQECAPNCAFALYFPEHDEVRFALVHAVFGATNAAKLLAQLESEKRPGAVQNLVDQALAWVEETGFGSVPYITFLKNMLEQAKGAEVAARVDFEQHADHAPARMGQAQVAGHDDVILPQLVHDAIHEILLRLPPTDPASIIRSGVVCKPWRKILTDLAFLRRYRAFHRTPFLLGFVHEEVVHESNVAKFVPIVPFRTDVLECPNCRMLDCRHGRVLLQDLDSGELIVWNPVTGAQRRVPEPMASIGVPVTGNFNAVVFCGAGAGCDHRGCSDGPFSVAFTCIEQYVSHVMVHGSVFSSVTGTWRPRSSERDFVSAVGHNLFQREPGVVIDTSAYFLLGGYAVLRYDMEDRSMGKLTYRYDVEKVEHIHFVDAVVIMEAQNGTFGLTMLFGHRLRFWSVETAPNGGTELVHTMMVNLQPPYPVTAPSTLGGYSDVSRSIFVSSSDKSLFSINTTTLQTNKVCRLGKRVNQIKFPLYLSI